jgi:hypothetical protein
VQGVPDDAGLRRTDAIKLSSGIEKLAAGVAVHHGDVSGETERRGLGLPRPGRPGVCADQACAVPGPVPAVGLWQRLLEPRRRCGVGTFASAVGRTQPHRESRQGGRWAWLSGWPATEEEGTAYEQHQGCSTCWRSGPDYYRVSAVPCGADHDHCLAGGLLCAPVTFDDLAVAEADHAAVRYLPFDDALGALADDVIHGAALLVKVRRAARRRAATAVWYWATPALPHSARMMKRTTRACWTWRAPHAGQ